MTIETKALDQAWSDVVKVAKFCLSCFGVAASSYVVAYNLNMTKYNFPNVTGPKDKDSISIF